MDVGGHGYSQFIPNPAKQSATGFQTDATVGFDRCSIGLVVGRLKDPRNAQRITDLLKIVRDRHHELLRLDHTWTENIKRSWSPNFHAPNVEAFHHSKAGSNGSVLSPKYEVFCRRSVDCFSRRERSAHIFVVRVERATRKNSQLAPARRVAMKMGRRLRCSSVTYRFRYAPSSRLAGGPF